MSQPVRHLYEFGPFCLDATERLLALAERFRGAAGREANVRDLAWREEAFSEAKIQIRLDSG